MIHHLILIHLPALISNKSIDCFPIEIKIDKNILRSIERVRVKFRGVKYNLFCVDLILPKEILKEKNYAERIEIL